MPLILAQNEMSESGISYTDKTGVSYEYPAMYRNIIVKGERFIYYRGRKTFRGNRSPQVYFGCGVIGTVRKGLDNTSRWNCEILDYRPFESPVLFKKGHNQYLEVNGIRRGYFQRGVRRITEEEFDNILTLSNTLTEATTIKPSPDTVPYASPETRLLVDAFAIEHARHELAKEFSNITIATMPSNNPGFDLIVESSPVKYVEVKGTLAATPGFFITAGELTFSGEHHQSYILIVIYDINLRDGTYKVYRHNGDVNTAPFHITPIQFRVRPLPSISET